jgi:SAM-dependent methyltransferase
MNNESKRDAVRNRYATIAGRGASGCCGESSCCGDSGVQDSGAQNSNAQDPVSKSSLIGYSVEEISILPGGADLGLGCGNPTAIAGIKEGETVVDLGSGAGIDCFLAARRVGPSGKVIGVDMTHEMISRARKNAAEGNYSNVEFRLGEIEHLPIADGTVDLIISNCVINLSPDKESVFSEAFRVLKSGGRMMVSDIVLKGELPRAVKEDTGAYCSCISGAIELDRYIGMIRAAGFVQIRVDNEKPFGEDLVVKTGDDEAVLPEGVVVSAYVTAVKP